MQERILGHLDQVQDILALGSASRAAQAAVAHASWTGVHCLRWAGIAQSPPILDTGSAAVLPASPQAYNQNVAKEAEDGHSNGADGLSVPDIDGATSACRMYCGGPLPDTVLPMLPATLYALLAAR